MTRDPLVSVTEQSNLSQFLRKQIGGGPNGKNNSKGYDLKSIVIDFCGS